MARVTFPVTQVGLIVPVWIGLNGEAMEDLFESGKPLVPPLAGQGLLDTGTDMTAVSADLLRRLGVLSHLTAETHTASGRVGARLYRVSLSIMEHDPDGVGVPWLAVSDLLVMELPASVPDVDVLIGLDIILAGRLEIDGPARQFTLVF